LSNKLWINKIILLEESAKYLIIKENLISNLLNELTENNYSFIDINLKDSEVKKIFFISSFINNLSNLGYSTNNIYIFLIIPIILTIIIIFKHFIGLSPIWIILPLFITILFFKIGLGITLFLLVFYVCLNLFLSFLINRFNLLYAPKMVFLLTINIIFFILIINILYTFNFISPNLNDVVYFIVFIIITEKIINIIISKDLLEYKEPFFYTLNISIFCFLLLNINTIKIILLAYPEMIIVLIFINFLIWKFSWLRVSEYFRFKEIIKNIEE